MWGRTRLQEDTLTQFASSNHGTQTRPHTTHETNIVHVCRRLTQYKELVTRYFKVRLTSPRCYVITLPRPHVCAGNKYWLLTRTDANM
jgi:hypothetical protein